MPCGARHKFRISGGRGRPIVALAFPADCDRPRRARRGQYAFLLRRFRGRSNPEKEDKRASPSKRPQGSVRYVQSSPLDDRHRRRRHADFSSRRRAGISHQADHADRPMAGGRLDRHLDARDRRKRLQGARTADRHRQQGRRQRHRRPCHHGGRRQVRRLHHRPDPDHRVPPAADAGSLVESGQGFHLYRPPHRLHVRRHHQRRVAVQDLAGRRSTTPSRIPAR